MKQKNTKIKKLIIPAAGWGTRFLPMTKVIPKELVPILNRPSIDLLVDEAILSGVEEIILVISKRKQKIMNYFENNEELEEELEQKGKETLLLDLQKTNRYPYIRVVYQYEQLGLGHAILTGARFFKNEPFAVILGDDLIKSKQPAIGQLIDFYNLTNSSVVGVQEIEKEKTNLYGIVKPQDKKDIDNKFFKIEGAVEKPKTEDAPTNKAILGRYVFNYKIVDFLEKKLEEMTKSGKILDQELDLVSVFEEYLKIEDIYAYTFTGERFDLGSIEGFVKATITYSLENKEINKEIKDYLKNEVFKKIN